MLAIVNGVFRLTRDIELKYLPSGSVIAKLGLVNSSKYKTQAGEQKEDTTFIDGTVFGKSAEIINQYCKKGSKIFVNAELKMEQWDDANTGAKRTKHTLAIKGFEFLDSKNDAPQSQGQPQQGGQNQQPQMQQQQNQGYNNQQQQQNYAQQQAPQMQNQGGQVQQGQPQQQNQGYNQNQGQH